MSPGKNSEKFKLWFCENWFKRGELIDTLESTLIITSVPKLRDRWWWKILRFITFGYFFQPDIYYTVKIHEKYETN
jgi:hypothetical protein